MKKLTEKQVESIYRKYPEIEDPNYKFKKTISVDYNEIHTIDIKIDGKYYRILSDPVKNDDIWFIKDTDDEEKEIINLLNRLYTLLDNSDSPIAEEHLGYIAQIKAEWEKDESSFSEEVKKK